MCWKRQISKRSSQTTAALDAGYPTGWWLPSAATRPGRGVGPEDAQKVSAQDLPDLIVCVIAVQQALDQPLVEPDVVLSSHIDVRADAHAGSRGFGSTPSLSAGRPEIGLLLVNSDQPNDVIDVVQGAFRHPVPRGTAWWLRRPRRQIGSGCSLAREIGRGRARNPR